MTYDTGNYYLTEQAKTPPIFCIASAEEIVKVKQGHLIAIKQSNEIKELDAAIDERIAFLRENLDEVLREDLDEYRSEENFEFSLGIFSTFKEKSSMLLTKKPLLGLNDDGYIIAEWENIKDHDFVSITFRRPRSTMIALKGSMSKKFLGTTDEITTEFIKL